MVLNTKLSIHPTHGNGSFRKNNLFHFTVKVATENHRNTRHTPFRNRIHFICSLPTAKKYRLFKNSARHS